MDISKLLNELKSNPSEKFESEQIEFKNFASENALHNSKELAEEISALANCIGGKIIIGVIDSSNISGNKWHQQLSGFPKIDLDTTKERLLGRLNPRINLKLFEFDFEGKNYLVIDVPNVTHSIVSTNSGKVCIRTGKSSYPGTPDQIQELVKNLQSYDWSAEDIDIDPLQSIDSNAILEAKKDFCERRRIAVTEMSDLNFLESIGATKNGLLNKGGLLFLGKRELIREKLGVFEYRFSWKTNNGQLLVNDVWDDCIWNTIKRAKIHFNACNSTEELEYENKKYTLNKLDSQAFHEALLNSIVHRDFTVDGMTIINYKGYEMIITNPGTFYGGVNSDNISFHEPRHRNKSLAKTLMDFQLVDRAGMGVLRMGLNSLRYGREFPKFREKENNIEVVMSAEYIKTGVFLLTQKYIPDCGLAELHLLNSLYRIGAVSLTNLERDLIKIVENPWNSIERLLERKEFQTFFELRGTNNGIFICPHDSMVDLFEITKPFKAASNSEKHVKLYFFLKQNKSASNEEIMQLLNYSSPAATYQFLRKLKYVFNTGKSRNSIWKLKSN